ncbi:head-tail adaptor protein [Rhizobium sp. 768_B6_N1_8]|uniref:head-tail adaptor protein n=1 Tax=unclassified Rhizobium TaxID=2613769 RepID=UPI003F29858A
MAGRSSSSDLYERVAFDERATVQDGYGNEQASFVERFQCRAGFTPLRGGETVIASRLQGRQPIVVRIRASRQSRMITPDWRMRDARNGEWAGDDVQYWTGPIYAIRSIIETDDRMFLDLMVESGVAA